MDAFENGLELKPSHTIGNDRVVKKANEVECGVFFLMVIQIKTPI